MKGKPLIPYGVTSSFREISIKATNMQKGKNMSSKDSGEVGRAFVSYNGKYTYKN